MLCGHLLVIYISDIRLHINLQFHIDEAVRVHQDVEFAFMTPSDWVSPPICFSGLRFWL